MTDRKRPPIGTMRWCEDHGARLTGRERLRMVRMLVRAQVRDAAERVLWRLLGTPAAVSGLDLDAVTIPDSAVARRAEEYAREEFTAPLLMHGYRTYFWGSLLGQFAGLQPDRELFFVSSLLHDAGLSARHLPAARHTCFTVAGAREVHRLAVDAGWEADRAVRAYEAVSLHLNMVIDPDTWGAEAHLVGAGATMDVAGAMRHRVRDELIARVHERYPREGFRAEILEIIGNVPHAPGTRPHLFPRLGFGAVAARNPLDGVAPGRAAQRLP